MTGAAASLGALYVVLVTGVNAAIGAGVGAVAGGRGRRGKGAVAGAALLGGVGLAVSTIEVVAVSSASKQLAAAGGGKALR